MSTGTPVHVNDSTEPSQSRRGPAWWVVAVIGLVAAGLGLGLGYVVFAPKESATTVAEVSAEEVDRVVATLDAYEEAWNANDADAVLALFADDYVKAEGLSVEASRRMLRNEVGQMAAQSGTWEFVGDPLVVPQRGRGGYDVSAAWVSSTATSSDSPPGITIYHLVDEDGVLKIQRATYNSDWFLGFASAS